MVHLKVKNCHIYYLVRALSEEVFVETWLYSYLNSNFLNFTETAVGVKCDPSQTDECKDPHSSCVPADSEHKCLCNVGYYDYIGTCTLREFKI